VRNLLFSVHVTNGPAKSVSDLFPASTCMAIEKKALALVGIWIDGAAHGQLGSAFLQPQPSHSESPPKFFQARDRLTS
jgi:hypothetical protein